VTVWITVTTVAMCTVSPRSDRVLRLGSISVVGSGSLWDERYWSAGASRTELVDRRVWAGSGLSWIIQAHHQFSSQSTTVCDRIWLGAPVMVSWTTGRNITECRKTTQSMTLE